MNKLLITLISVLLVGCSVNNPSVDIRNKEKDLILAGEEMYYYSVEFCRPEFCTDNLNPEVLRNFFLYGNKEETKIPEELDKIAWGEITVLDRSEEEYVKRNYDFELYPDGYLLFDDEEYKIVNMDEVKIAYPKFFDLLELKVKQIRDNFKSQSVDLVTFSIGSYTDYEITYKSEETKKRFLDKIGSIRYLESYLGEMGAGHWGFYATVNDGEPLFITYGIDNIFMSRNQENMKSYDLESLYLSVDDFEDVVFGNFDLSLAIPGKDSDSSASIQVYYYENDDLSFSRIDNENYISHLYKFTVEDIESMELTEINRIAFNKDFTTLITELPKEVGEIYTVYIESIDDGVIYHADFNYQVVLERDKK